MVRASIKPRYYCKYDYGSCCSLTISWMCIINAAVPPGIIPYFYYKSAYASYVRALPRASTTARERSGKMWRVLRCASPQCALYLLPQFPFSSLLHSIPLRTRCFSLDARFNLSLMRAGARGHVHSTMAKDLVSKWRNASAKFTPTLPEHPAS